MTPQIERARAARALFSVPTLRSVIGGGGESSLASEAISRAVASGLGGRSQTVRSLVLRSNRWLETNYRNDTVYRQAVVDGLLPGRGAILPEFRANTSVVDVLSVERTLHAIEIKSDVDGTGRLARQVLNYRSIAPKVSLVGSERIVERCLRVAEYEHVGMYVVNTAGKLEVARSAVEDRSELSTCNMLRSLRRPEYTDILAELGVDLTSLPNTQVYRSAMDAVRHLDPMWFQTHMAAKLASRVPRARLSALRQFPKPLRPSLLRLSIGEGERQSVNHWLESGIR